MPYLIMIYAALSYCLFLAVSGWLAAFLLDISDIRSSAASASWPVAATVDIALISLFGLTHSVMARPGFKKKWTRIIPPAAERATYVLLSSVFLALVFCLWQPIDGTIWQIEGFLSYGVLAVFFTGLGVIVLATFLLGHSEFTGLQQAWNNLKNTPAPQPDFRTPLLYQVVRHPLQLGNVMILFAVPHMTTDGLLFAVVMLVYILIGLKFEERALLKEFGTSYGDYQQSVPLLIPLWPFKISARGPRKGRFRNELGK